MASSQEGALTVYTSLSFGAGTALNCQNATVSNFTAVQKTRTVVTDATYTVQATDQIVGVSRAGAVTLTLPAASALQEGQEIFIKDEGGNALTYPITVNPAGGDTIGDGTYASFRLENKDEGLVLYSDGASVWHVR